MAPLIAYRALRHAAAPLAGLVLARRRARGKEHPDRWRERLGHAGAPRPSGRLVWLNAVGLGEVLALRGLIETMREVRPDLDFLITATARTAAEALERNPLPGTRQQFLPLDLPGPSARFLDHWRPDLSVWAEQDLWPGLVDDTARRGIPLALVNARMSAAAFARRRKAKGLFAATLARFDLIAAQDEATARHLSAFGAAGVEVTGSLKPAAPSLADDADARARLAGAIGPREVIAAASTHAEDERVLLDALALLHAEGQRPLVIAAPRQRDRGPVLAQNARREGLDVAIRSAGETPGAGTDLYVADTIGELGLWYRMAKIALVGGTFGAVEGHNPWEAARLGTAILHGPRTANFAADYAALDAAGGALSVAGASELATALTTCDRAAMADKASALADTRAAPVRALAVRLAGMVAPP